MAWNVVIAGGGFGGAFAARELERLMPRQSARIILVNDVNFLLYTPFLPAAAGGLLEPRHVVTPLRSILHRTNLRLGAVTGHDAAARTVTVRDHEGGEEELGYDQLLLSVGSVSRVLPVPGLDRHAIGFKSLADAIWLRNHVIYMLELANAAEDRALRDELLTFVFVGGGYAGLEALAELQDLAAEAMEVYPRARLHGMRWILVEATDRVMPEIDARLADYAARELRGRGIDIRLGTTVEEVGESSVTLSTGETFPSRTVVWTAGVAAHPSLKALGVPLNERGRVPTDDHLRVEGVDSVWAVGDCASVPDPTGGVCPPTAQHAIRQGKTAGHNIAAALGIGSPRRFDYESKGAFVDLGRHKAVAKVGNRTISGFPAWWMARSYHVSQIPGMARKFHAVADWTLSLPFRRDVADVGSIGHPRPLRAEVYERGGSHRPLD